MKELYRKHGWAILITWRDGSSGFKSAEGTHFPKIWPEICRMDAVAELKAVKSKYNWAKARVVKVKANWPELI
jgi:hypothetical protein